MDWQTVISVISFIAVLAILIERALSFIFEHPIYIKLAGNLKIKEAIAICVSFTVCYVWSYDAFATLLKGPTTTFGFVLTALAIAGGSKGSLYLFRDLMSIKDASASTAAADPSAPN